MTSYVYRFIRGTSITDDGVRLANRLGPGVDDPGDRLSVDVGIDASHLYDVVDAESLAELITDQADTYLWLGQWGYVTGGPRDFPVRPIGRDEPPFFRPAIKSDWGRYTL
jgi:hypothetical protein